jgi:glycosyltransferase involved in cell wall biosynthesis
MKRILYIIDEATIGGGQVHVLLLASSLDRNMFDVAVMCEEKGFLVDELQRRGIRFVPISISNTFNISALWDCYKKIKKINPDIVHTHGGTAGFYGRIAAFLAGIKSIIHTYHGIHYVHNSKSFSKAIFMFVEQLLVWTTDKIIFVCRSDEKLAAERSLTAQNKSVVIYNGIDVESFARLDNNEVQSSITSVDFGTVGRLHHQKGHQYLLMAFAIVKKEISTATLRIVGSGELLTQLQALAVSLGIEKSVEFSGARTDVKEQILAMNCFVLPSLWEGLPLVMLEAMAVGKPVIATSVDGIVEIARHGEEALFVKPADPDQLADAMIKIYSNKELAKKIGNAGTIRVREIFSVQQMVNKTTDVYKKLLGLGQ